MKGTTLRLTGGLVALIALTSFGQIASQTAKPTPVPTSKAGQPGLAKMLEQKDTMTQAQALMRIPSGLDVLEKVVDEITAGKVPAEIYPPGYFERLIAIGDQPIYQFQPFDRYASALKAGDKANMEWMDATFTMGSPTTEANRFSGEVQHTVTLTSGFYISKYEVTQGEYLDVVGSNPSYFTPANGYSADLNRPVENVSWLDASNYCRLLTQRELTAGHIQSSWQYRLPTEAEWEYSCRAGTITALNFGSSIHGGDANFETHYEYDASSGETYIPSPSVPYLARTETVGNYIANGFGLYDMHGNTWEYCQDWYEDPLTSSPVIDPQGPTTGTYKVIRGGAWYNHGKEVRSAIRLSSYINQGSSSYGFRTVLAPIVPEWKTAITADTSRYSLVNIGTIPSGKDSIIVITHGRIPNGDDPSVSTAWVDSMSNSITSYLTAHSINNWQVLGYKWTGGAQASILDVLENAKQQGVGLGLQIIAQGYTHVHFIAHSAGAGVIQSATDVIKANNSSVVVQDTFLDPYVGPKFEGTTWFGNGANWAENYSTKDHDTYNEVVPFTYNILTHCYNVDVTHLDVNGRKQLPYWVTGSGTPCYTTESTHAWPIYFYSNTIVGAVTSDYEGFGFGLSEVGGNWNYALSHYTVGNGSPGHILGTPDPTGCRFEFPAPSYPSFITDFINSPAVQSDTGTINKYPNGSIKETSGSPAWLATFVTVSNVANVVSFDAQFQSSSGAQGLLSVYWDGSTIGSIDERVVQTGLQHYTFKFSNAESNSMHMLGFRLDPFTNVQSVVIVTNVTTTFSGASQPFSLAITGSTGGLLTYQLTGQSGLEYHIQASTNLIDWTPIAVLANTNGAVQFTDQDSANYPIRFYRAVEPF